MTKTTTREIKAKPLLRAAQFERASVNEDDRTIDLAFSSEEPVDRWFGKEILDHAPTSIRLGRLENGGPVLVDHDPRDHVGVVESVSVNKDRRGRALVRFGKSERATEIFNDVKDGIRTKVSVSYRIHKIVLEEQSDDQGDTYRATDWEPVEISIVSIPADDTVGIGRAAEAEENTIQVIEPAKERKMAETNPATPAAEKKPDINVREIQENERRAERERTREILAIGEKYGQADMARTFINDGKSIDEFREAVLERMGKPKPIPMPDDAAEIGMTDKEVRNFSFLRAIRALSATGSEQRKAWEDAAFEREVSEATAEKMGREARGLMVPFDVLSRDLTTSTASGTPKAGNLVATDLLSGSFIDVLRSAMVLRQAGAQFLTGLQGNIAIPRKTSGASVYWVAEANAPTEGNAAFDQVTMSPNTLAANQDYSRKLLIQSSLDVENMVRNDLAMGIAVELDRVGINGSGSGAEPTGVLGTSGIGSITLGTNGGAPTWAMVVNLMKEVGVDNALMGSLGYITNYATVGKLMQTPKVSSTDSVMIMNDPANLLGYPVHKTNNCPSNLTKGSGSSLSAMLFGNWTDLLIGMWGALDIIVDPYTQSKAGVVQVTAFAEADVAVRHAESFAECNEIVTT